MGFILIEFNKKYYALLGEIGASLVLSKSIEVSEVFEIVFSRRIEFLKEPFRDPNTGETGTVLARRD